MDAWTTAALRRSRTQLILIKSLVAVAITVAAQGCLPAPQTSRRAGLSTTAATSTTTSTTQFSTTRIATTDGALSNLWKAEVSPPHKQPDSNAAAKTPATGTGVNVAAVNTSPRRIAIIEFTVEFVTVRSRTPFDSQLAVKIPPWDPIGGALEVIGLSRAQTLFKPEDRTAITTTLFNQFTTNLHDVGYTVIPESDIHAQPAYDTLTKGHPDNASADSSPLDFARLLATDVGVINASTAQPAPGMRLLDQDLSQEDFRKSESLLLQQTGADATIAVHLLVGCYNNRAAIEERSRVRVLRSGAQEVALTSQRSLLSDKKVRKPGHFMPVLGMVEPVRMDEFDREIGELIDPYLAPALEAGLHE
jgi:hypothetical protein